MTVSRRQLHAPAPSRGISGSRFAQSINLAIFLGALLIILVAVNFFASKPELRVQIDATKTRAYSLSEQTRHMLENLDGQYTIAMVVSDANVSRPLRRQMDEVLSRYTQASPHVRVLRIDPNNPRTLREYETLLRDLTAIYADRIKTYDQALDAGVVAFNELRLFADRQSALLAPMVNGLPQTEQTRSRLATSVGLLGLMGEQGGQVVDAINGARAVSESQPIPDYEGARSILAEALSQWASETDAVAAVFRSWLQRPNLGAEDRPLVTKFVGEFEAMSQQLAQAADPLKQLPEMELTAIGQQLAGGEAAVIIGPKRAAVIPSAAMFPKSNFRTTRMGATLFDQRFRGEHLISSAIRSLTLDQMPMVVFVHADGRSLMQIRDPAKRDDVLGAAVVLRTARYDVREWDVTKKSPRPTGAAGQRMVWVVVPPARGQGLQAAPESRALFEAVDQLIGDGENVLLSVYPSVVAKYGQSDPFQFLAQPFGLKPETAQVVLERVQAGQNQAVVSAQFAGRDFSSESVIGRAVDGQQTLFPVPVVIGHMPDAAASGVNITDVMFIDASPQRWLEAEWTGDIDEREPRAETTLVSPAPIVVAAERASAGPGGSQRMIVVGSGGWMLTGVADNVRDLGGGRTALDNPGNHELLLASVAWLAGQDELIAASPLTQEVSRLRGVSPAVRAAWWWMIVVGVPTGCLLMGLIVFWWRRI